MPAPDSIHPIQTHMRLHAAEDWSVRADFRADQPPEQQWKLDAEGFPLASLRRVGWLDQKGRVWVDVPPTSAFDGGSLTPLLI